MIMLLAVTAILPDAPVPFRAVERTLTIPLTYCFDNFFIDRPVGQCIFAAIARWLREQVCSASSTRIG
jgi:hypothetical protein